MRVDLTKPVRVRRGDVVTITAKLPSGQSLARISLWSAQPGIEMSPHVSDEFVGAVDHEGHPAMLKPMFIRLHELHRTHRMQFTAHSDMAFLAKQEIEVASDPRAKVRITSHGKAAASLRRILRNAIRSVRDFATRTFGRA